MHKYWGLVLGVLVLVVDQGLKLIMPGLINYTAFLSIPISNQVLLVAQIVLLILLAIYLGTQKTLKNLQFWLLIIFFAGISNTLDRLIHGGVVDYINLYFFVANLADIAINLSMFAIMIEVIKQRWQNYK